MIDIQPDTLDWQKCPLMPAIVQDASTRQILMLGYMNPDALRTTLDTGKVTFFSRSRQTLWTKGETSGNTLICKRIFADCDRDTLLVQADPQGPTCHLGTTACFNEPSPRAYGFLGELADTIDSRLAEGGDESYVARLSSAGIEKMAQKIGEEGVELSIACVSGRRDDILNEAADLLFHTLVALRSQELTLDDVVETLRARSR